jgi:hypothetical protein
LDRKRVDWVEQGELEQKRKLERRKNGIKDRKGGSGGNSG